MSNFVSAGVGFFEIRRDVQLLVELSDFAMHAPYLAVARGSDQ